MKFPRASGILLHPTSLPGPDGSGDLGASCYHFIDWLATAGQKLWQVLPLGNIGAGYSPYMSPSAFAGNPLLIDLHELAEHGWLSRDELPADAGFDSKTIHFEKVLPWREQRLAAAAAGFFAKARARERGEFQHFCEQQVHWLEDYALYMALQTAYGARSWQQWPDGLAQRTPQALTDARRHFKSAIDAQKFWQWNFYRQWQSIRRYANEKGIQVIGDAPIFVALQSADVWAQRHLFELDAAGKPEAVAGVPPDYFSATGQRWGNPLYRWSTHAQEGYQWWIERVRSSLQLFDMLRIDHFRGFAAHWRIPVHEATALKGEWVLGPGAALFDALASALGPLPIIAEDLGIITPDVVSLRRRFDLPGMAVLQFAFGGDSGNLYLPHNHHSDLVVYTGTHDNNTSVGWWQSLDPAEQSRVCDYLGAKPQEIHWSLIRLACASVADTAIYPLQDVLGLDASHRMNVPGHGDHCWRWRFTWEQFGPEPAERLAALCRLYRRDGTPLNY